MKYRELVEADELTIGYDALTDDEVWERFEPFARRSGKSTLYSEKVHFYEQFDEIQELVDEITELDKKSKVGALDGIEAAHLDAARNIVDNRINGGFNNILKTHGADFRLVDAFVNNRILYFDTKDVEYKKSTMLFRDFESPLGSDIYVKLSRIFQDFIYAAKKKFTNKEINQQQLDGRMELAKIEMNEFFQNNSLGFKIERIDAYGSKMQGAEGGFTTFDVVRWDD